MIGEPWVVGDFQMLYYQCTSGVKKDIVIRKVPATKYVVWQVYLSDDDRRVLVDFKCRGCSQTTDPTDQVVRVSLADQCLTNQTNHHSSHHTFYKAAIKRRDDLVLDKPQTTQAEHGKREIDQT